MEIQMFTRSMLTRRKCHIAAILSCTFGSTTGFAHARQITTPETDNHTIESSRIEECGTDIKGFTELLQPGALIVFGELHGTQEAPAMVGNLACRALLSNHAVRVGVEIPINLQPDADAFLSSKGNQLDIERLTRGSFWSFADGRSSKAMLALFDKIRQLKQANRDVDIFLFDLSPPTFNERDKSMVKKMLSGRDKGMAENILSTIEKNPNAVSLILTGNLHARTSNNRWMGWHLMQPHKQMVSLNIAYSGGSAWVCGREGCGPTKSSGIDRGDKLFIERFTKPDYQGYHGIYYVGSITTSPPASASAATHFKGAIHK